MGQTLNSPFFKANFPFQQPKSSSCNENIVWKTQTNSRSNSLSHCLFKITLLGWRQTIWDMVTCKLVIMLVLVANNLILKTCIFLFYWHPTPSGAWDYRNWPYISYREADTGRRQKNWHFGGESFLTWKLNLSKNWDI